eukprot:EG_transcript_4444
MAANVEAELGSGLPPLPPLPAMQAASFSTYVRYGRVTPKSNRWYIDVGVERAEDGDRSMSIATRRMNLRQALLLNRAGESSPTKSQMFITQRDEGADLEQLNERPISTSAGNAVVVNQLFDSLRQVKELVDLELGGLGIPLTPPVAGLGLPGMTLHPAASVRLGHFLSPGRAEAGFLPQIKSPVRITPKKAKAARVDAPPPDTEADLWPDQYFFNEPAARPRSPKADRARIEQNVTLAKDWHTLKKAHHEENTRRAKERQRETRERCSSLEEQKLTELMMKQERKAQVSQKVLMAQRDAEYVASLKGWLQAIKATVWLLNVRRGFALNRRQEQQHGRQQWAKGILACMFVPRYRLRMRRKVWENFPPGSRAHRVLVSWITRTVAVLRAKCVARVRYFLKGPVHFLNFYLVMRRLRQQVVHCQSLWRMKLAQARVRMLYLEQAYVAMERTIATLRDSRILADARFLATVKHQLMCHQKGTQMPHSPPWQEDVWPLPNPKPDQIESQVMTFLKTPAIQTLATAELTLRRSRVTVLAENAAYRLSDADLHQTLVDMGILVPLEPTTPQCRGRILARYLKDLQKECQWRANVGDGPQAIAALPVLLTVDREAMAVLVRKGLAASNPRLRNTPLQTLVHEPSPRRQGRPGLPPLTVYFKGSRRDKSPRRF